jgi:thiol-disulfide isomerase/thioredoxin
LAADTVLQDAGSLAAAEPDALPAEVKPPAPVAEPGRSAVASRLADVESVLKAIQGEGRVRIVNHWATWCSSCVEELPLLLELSRRLGPDIEMIGVSWDGFQAMVPRSQLVDEVEQCALQHGLSWGSLVVDADPETFFERLDLSSHTVPQVWVVDEQGNVVHRIDEPLDKDGVEQIVDWVQAL